MASIVISGDTSGAVTLSAPAISGTTTLTLPTTSGTLVVTGGAQTVQFAAGSAAAPSITFTGDTNTGIFSPAADSIAFTEGGVESMRIDASGNVGIGTSTMLGRLTAIGNIVANGGGTGDPEFRLSGASGGVTRNYAMGTDGAQRLYWYDYTAAAYRMLIDSSGNVGIGTSSPTNKLDVVGNMIVGDGGNTRGLYVGPSGFTGAFLYRADGNCEISPRSGYSLLFMSSPGGTERMRINSSGQVLIGTTSGNGVFTIQANNTQLWHDCQPSYLEQSLIGSSGTNIDWYQSTKGTGAFIWRQAGTTERMRITSGGDLLVGSTTDQDQRVRVTCNGVTPQWGIKVHNTATTGNNQFIEFGTEAGFTARGSITYNRAGGTVSYNTTSDYRLKENIVDLPNALQTVSKLKPRQFDWKETGNTTTGFIAHELAEVLPHAVTGEKDAVDKDGSPKYQGIDTSFLVATLTAAIQELNAKVEAQAAEIAALKGAN